MKPTQRLVAYDDRVLGSGSFVERLWREDELRDRLAPPLTLDEVLEKVADRFGLAPARVRWRSTDPRVTEARGLVCSIGVDALGLQATEVGRVLGLGRSGASRCLARGRAFALREPEHVEEILKSVNPAVDAGSRGGNQLGSSVP